MKVFQNNKITIKLIFMVMLLSFSYGVNAQKKKAGSNAFITIHVTDTVLAKHPLTMQLVKDYLFGFIGAKETIVKGSNGYYKYHLIGISGISKFSIIEKSSHLEVIEGYIEPGDNVIIEYNGKSSGGAVATDYIFSGRGNSKFVVRNLLIHGNPNNLIINKANSPLNAKYLDTLSTIADSNYKYYKRILTTFKSKISKKSYKVLDADIYGRAYSSLLSYLPEFYSFHPGADASFKDTILLYLPKLEDKTFKGFSQFALQSQDYINYLYAKARVFSRLKYNSTKAQDIYRELVSQNTGAAREKVLIYSILKGQTGQKGNDLDYVISSALKYINDPDHRQVVAQQAYSIKAGAEAYQFVMPDSTGRLISLKDFRGKIVIIDCWFTGCSSCSDLAKIIDKEVLPKYIDNDKVVFLSVCVDKSKDLWKKSLRTGLYTNVKSINLFTAGLALNHPFIKQYHFQGFPQIMLIDKNGRIFSPALPRKWDEMIEVIDQALKLM